MYKYSFQCVAVDHRRENRFQGIVYKSSFQGVEKAKVM